MLVGMKFVARNTFSSTSLRHTKVCSSVLHGSVRPFSHLETVRETQHDLTREIASLFGANIETKQEKLPRRTPFVPPENTNGVRLEDVYEVSGLLGQEGGSGLVRIGRHREHGCSVSVRAVKGGADIEVLKAASDPNIFQIHEMFQGGEYDYIVKARFLKPTTPEVTVQGDRPRLEDVYEVSGLLGQEGGAGHVRVGRHRELGCSVSVTAVLKGDKDIEILKATGDPNIFEIHESFEGDEYDYIVRARFLKGGD